jgi:hypothetical protein
MNFIDLNLGLKINQKFVAVTRVNQAKLKLYKNKFGTNSFYIIHLHRINYLLLCVVNLSRCGERIGSLTRRQPTKSQKPKLKIGKPVLIPTLDEETGKDKLKKKT